MPATAAAEACCAIHLILKNAAYRLVRGPQVLWQVLVLCAEVGGYLEAELAIEALLCRQPLKSLLHAGVLIHDQIVQPQSCRRRYGKNEVSMKMLQSSRTSKRDKRRTMLRNSQKTPAFQRPFRVRLYAVYAHLVGVYNYM